MEKFEKERNEAFASMNKDKIIAYCKKYDIYIPEDENVFWAGVHKTVCYLFLLKNTPINTDQYLYSYHWLKRNGYIPFPENTKDDKKE